MDAADFVTETEAGEVFAVLADDTRVAILQALWETEDYEASFSELRDAVGMRDSGQFNYHLDKLVGPFVAKTEDGYELTQAGKQINGAIEAGAYTVTGTFDPIPLESPCPTCRGDQTLRYEDDTVHVECDGCQARYQFGVPPAAFAGYDREEIPAVASRYLRTKVRGLHSGFCPFCGGRVDPTVGAVADLDDIDEPPAEVSNALAEQIETIPLIEFACQQCEAAPRTGLYFTLLDHPAVAGFFYDHGINVEDRSVWDFPDMDPDHQIVRSRDPFRASVTYEADGDALTVVVDEHLSVVDIEAR
jgi:hypothetical protein